jgi:hypothetical protein
MDFLSGCQFHRHPISVSFGFEKIADCFPRRSSQFRFHVFRIAEFFELSNLF